MSFKAVKHVLCSLWSPRTVIIVVNIQPFMNQPTIGSKNAYSLSSILLEGGHLCCPNAPQDSLAARPGVQTSNACKNLGWEVKMLNNLVMFESQASFPQQKINMEPENTPLEKQNNLPDHHFQILC